MNGHDTPKNTETAETAATDRDLKPLWIGAAVTTTAVGLFPRLNAVINEDVPIWHLDPEARILFPAILILSLLLFFFLGRWAWRAGPTGNRPAKVGVVCGGLSIVGAVAFFLSLPIMLGGLAATLGLEGRRRAEVHGRSQQALAAIVLGAVGFLLGAGIWLLAGSI